MNIPPPSSVLKSEPSKKRAEVGLSGVYKYGLDSYTRVSPQGAVARPFEQGSVKWEAGIS
jgi:hypothetical protein